MPGIRRAYADENRAFAGLAVGGVLIVAAILVGGLWSWVFGLVVGAIGGLLLVGFAVRACV
jgi:hypothetical protein